MKTTNTGNRITRLVLMSCVSLALNLFMACSNDDAEPDFSSDDKEGANVDAAEDYYFDDTDDMAFEAFTEEEAEGGRIATDARLACAIRTHTGTKDNGTLRIDFGDGCTGPHGNVRKGAIVITHAGHWNTVGTYWTITFDNYSINDIKVEGIRTVTVTVVTDTLITHEIELTGGKLTWPDGRTATREASRKREYERHADDHTLDRLLIDGSAEGTMRNGNLYSIEIIETLVYSRACAAAGVMIPVSGKKLIKHGLREVTVDYGDGTCDNIVTLTNKNGRTITYEIKK
jgi:hypothetical protein